MEGFVEVETPMMKPMHGGAEARPFCRKHDALGIDRYFFFKQKTAYEIIVRLEFRRVLFRSQRHDGQVQWRTWHAYPQDGQLVATRTPRSEERRVGKECRSRWSPDH